MRGVAGSLVSGGGRRIAVSQIHMHPFRDGIRVHDAATGALLGRVDVPRVRRFLLLEGGDRLLSWEFAPPWESAPGASRNVRIDDVRAGMTGAIARAFRWAHPGDKNRLACSGDVAVAAQPIGDDPRIGGCLRGFDVRTGDEPWAIQTNGVVEVAGGSRWAVVGCALGRRTGSLADLAKGAELVAAAIDLSTRRVASIVDLRDGRVLREIPVGAAVNRTALSADERHAAIGAGDGTVSLWAATSGEPSHVLRGLSGTDVRDEVVFSPDGRRIAAMAAGAVATVWDVASGRILASILGARHGPSARDRSGGRALAFSPVGERVAAVFRDGSVQIFPVDAIAAGRAACRRELTAVERIRHDPPLGASPEEVATAREVALQVLKDHGSLAAAIAALAACRSSRMREQGPCPTGC
jgi:hypothetical protein